MIRNYDPDQRPISELVELKEADVCGETNWYWVKGDENAWSGPTENWIGAHSTKYYEHLTKQDVVVTAGANHGLHCRFFAKTFKRVYAFEPNPDAFYCLNLNAPYENVVKMQAALGMTCEIVRIAGGPEATGMWQVVDMTKEGYLVPCLTIDTLCLDACDFIQLDTEGYENQILIGAVDTIDKYHPVIACENGKNNDIAMFMEEHGYEYVDQSSADAIYKWKIPK